MGWTGRIEIVFDFTNHPSDTDIATKIGNIAAKEFLDTIEELYLIGTQKLYLSIGGESIDDIENFVTAMCDKFDIWATISYESHHSVEKRDQKFVGTQELTLQLRIEHAVDQIRDELGYMLEIMNIWSTIPEEARRSNYNEFADQLTSVANWLRGASKSNGSNDVTDDEFWEDIRKQIEYHLFPDKILTDKE